MGPAPDRLPVQEGIATDAQADQRHHRQHRPGQAITATALPQQAGHAARNQQNANDLLPAQHFTGKGQGQRQHHQRRKPAHQRVHQPQVAHPISADQQHPVHQLEKHRSQNPRPDIRRRPLRKTHQHRHHHQRHRVHAGDHQQTLTAELDQRVPDRVQYRRDQHQHRCQHRRLLIVINLRLPQAPPCNLSATVWSMTSHFASLCHTPGMCP